MKEYYYITKKINIYILHAGITHPSPYFYNFCKNLDTNKFSYVINKDLPDSPPNSNSIIYFNRLKRFYDSDSIDSAVEFIKKIKILKKKGWKIVWTIHNFFPIDRDITNTDYYVVEEFIKQCDLLFTLSDYMKNKCEEIYRVKVINHGMGTNTYEGSFDNDVVKMNKQKDDFIFTFVGNIYKYKMLKEVIDAFDKINCNAKLIIAGQEAKNSKVKIEELIKGKKNIIRYDSFIGNSDWEKLSTITDVFINCYDLNIPAFKYGFFPSNCVQLYNLGKPCISPKCEVIKELLPDNQVIYYNDINNIIDTMRFAMENYKKYINNNIDNTKYDWSKVIKIFSDNVWRLFYEN